MKRLAVWTLFLVAALAAAALPAAAADPSADPAAALFCAAPPAAEALVPEADLVILAAPPVICQIGCVNEEYCRRDSDCTTAPGGHCHLVCPRNGCCVY